MGNFLLGFLLPLLLLTASLINWSLVSLVDLVAFLIIQCAAPEIGCHFRMHHLSLWAIIIISILVILSQIVYLVIWAIEGDEWSGKNAWWAHLIGFMTVQSWKSPRVIYFLLVQVLAVIVALLGIGRNRCSMVLWEDSCWGRLLTILEHLGLQVVHNNSKF
uniref:Uncharacterized protein n=1 Tax=Rhizophora mucronata TaxID=61149 RepID=A0A2P2M0U0_RHIMU